MCLGGKNSSHPQINLPAVPTPRELLGFVDNTTKQKFTIGTDPSTGKKIHILDPLPRDPEKQLLYDKAQWLMNRSTDNLQRLAEYDPNQVVDFAPFVESINNVNRERGNQMQHLMQIPDWSTFVNNFTQINEDILDREFEKSTYQLEADLGRRGFASSTYGDELRADLAERRALAKAKLRGIDAPRYASQLRNEYLGQATQEYNLADQPRVGQLQGAEASYKAALQQEASLNQLKDREVAHNQLMFGIGQGIENNDTNLRLARNPAEFALAEAAQANAAQYGQYNAELNRASLQHQSNLAAYAARPPSFAQQLISGAAMVGGHMMAGPAGGAAAGAASTAFLPDSYTTNRALGR